MAEIKNSFLASKMNKDLDDRLIPSNEYKDALNVTVSSSEDSDVGTLQNILQNTQVFSISAASNLGFDNGKVIGYATDSSTDNIYLFWTNYKYSTALGPIDHQASSTGALTNSAIIQYNTKNNSFTKILVLGRFLNFSTDSLIHGANVVEDLLFWTDNRNQPRKINIKTASNFSNYYTSEDHISVAKYAPYKPIDLYEETSVDDVYETTMKDVVSSLLPDNTANPDQNVNYSGDSKYLEDKFVRFSYRFKYDDGEYSIIAPFTQIAFIPKQDGSFLAGDEDKAYQSTVVSFMENKVNQIGLIINLPTSGNNLEGAFKIKQLDILYKESDKISISVLDTINIEEIKSTAAASSVFKYSYQSRKPIKTLPQSQSTRVYDKTPVKALAQEVSGNRVIYGNYVNKHTAPDHLNYQVAATQKFSDGVNDNNWSYIEYPQHTLKRNRSYQVGFVLSDKYGRQSDVILSSVVSNTAANSLFGASTFHFPYRISGEIPTVLDSVGNSIKVRLNEPIQSTRSPLLQDDTVSTGEPGLYNATTNPTGWYSYKIVVKQTQQEYYNVYLPGFLKGDLVGGELTATHSVLIGDNINKVPRDLQEVGPLQDKYSSDEVLFPVVENVVPSSAGANHNQSFFPGNKKYEVTTIASFSDLNDLGGSANGVAELFESDEDPLIMRVGDNKGGLGGLKQHMLPTLSIAETTPFVSNLEVYYETTTSGLISELNESVLSGTGNPANSFNAFVYLHKESQNPSGTSNFTSDTTGANSSRYITDAFIPKNLTIGNLNNTTNTHFSVADKNGLDRTNDFTLESNTASSITSYRIKINTDFYFGADGSTKESYDFSMRFRNNADSVTSGISTTSAVTNQLTLPLNSVTNIFTSQIVSGTGIPAGTTVVDVSGSNITLSTSVTVGSGVSLVFTAPESSTLTKPGSLTNISPIVGSTSSLITFPNPWISAGSYFQAIVFNGAFSSSAKIVGITYTWNTSQPLFLGGNGVVSFYTSGDKKFIILSSNNVGSVSLSLDNNGKVLLESGVFDGIEENFTISFTATDAGGATVQIPILFTYIEPGVGYNFYRNSYATKNAACNGGETGSVDRVYMSKADSTNNFLNPGIQSNIQLYTDINKQNNYAPPAGAQYLFYDDPSSGRVALSVTAAGIINQSSGIGLFCGF